MALYLTNPSRLRNRLTWHRLYNEHSDPVREVFIPIDVLETKEAYQLSALVPGLLVEDLDIEIEGDLVTIKGEIKENLETEGHFLMKERSVGSFSRSLRLPIALDAEKSEAKMVNGVLSLQILKSENALPKKIQIKMK